MPQKRKNIFQRIDRLDGASKLLEMATGWAFRLLEGNADQKWGQQTPVQHPVFVIGAPRTGSTILYQLITNYLDVLYIDNVVHLFHRHLLTGFKLSHLLYNNHPHKTFASEYGKTYTLNMHAPSECGIFWYQFLPRSKHYISKGEMPREIIQKFHDKIYAPINKYKKPFLFKNLGVGQRLGFIHDLAPQARFIIMKRDPLYTAQSILLARRHFNTPPHQLWSIKPRQFEKISRLDEIEMVVQQIFYLNKQIEADRQLFPEQQFLTINYQELCQNMEETLQKVHLFVGKNTSYRDDIRSSNINLSERQKLNDEEFERLKMAISRLDWENYSE